MTEDAREDRELDRLFRTLDRPLPEITARDVVRRATGRQAAPLRLAAAIAAAVAVAGVAYALPGSPVPAWVHGVLEPVIGPGETGAPAVPHSPDPGAGLVLDPTEPLTLRIAPGSTGHLRIVRTEEGDLLVRMIAGEGRFTSDPNQLSVRLTAGDTLELRVPRVARSVAAIHAETTLFRKEGEAVFAVVPPDSAGLYELDLAAATP